MCDLWDYNSVARSGLVTAVLQLRMLVCDCVVAATRRAIFFQFGITSNDDAFNLGVCFGGSTELYTEVDDSIHFHTSTSSGLADNQWHNVVLSYTASTGTQGVYIDGVFKGYVRCGCFALLQYCCDCVHECSWAAVRRRSGAYDPPYTPPASGCVVIGQARHWRPLTVLRCVRLLLLLLLLPVLLLLLLPVLL